MPFKSISWQAIAKVPKLQLLLVNLDIGGNLNTIVVIRVIPLFQHRRVARNHELSALLIFFIDN